MVKVENPALTYHRVVVELLLEPLPKLHRPFVEREISRKQIVRANDRRVPADVPRPDIALLNDGDTRDPVLFRQVVCGREAMSAAPNYDDVVGVLGRCFSPKRLRPTVTEESIGEDSEGRVAHDCPAIDL